jgi:diguanylate cyclase (GGDEF)-like protein
MFRTSLQRRIAWVFVGLLVLVMGMVLALVRTGSQRIVANQAQHELAIGVGEFERLIDQNQRQLETAASVLSADFAFREAVATQDQATVRSVIANHGRRIHAQVMMVAGTDGRMIASTQNSHGADAPFPFPDLLAAAESSGRSAGFRQMRDGQPYQVVLVPIMAPRRIAWVAMGFRLDDRWARGLAEVAGLSVSIVRIGTGSRPALLASSFGKPPGAAERYQTTRLDLGGGLQAVLQLPLAQVEAPFEVLLAQLLAVVGAAIVFFALGSVTLARRIVKPLGELSAAAHRIALGDYGQPLPPQAAGDGKRDEIGRLAASFEQMRRGIASREDHIARLAYVDGLTDLPNRTHFLEAFAGMPAGASGVVAVLNIDRFAMINNALGYSVGDSLLRAVGERLAPLVPAPGMVARLWGGHFAFLLKDAGATDARCFADAALRALRDPITLDGQRLDIGSSIGIAMYPQDGVDGGTLLRRAELAMAAARKRHSSVAFVAEIGVEPPHEQLSLIGDMRAAMENGEFMTDYQPKLQLSSGRVNACEALLRWRHPERGMIAPGRFIPFAEQTGFIREITPWVLDEAIRQLAAWQQDGLDIVVSANLSTLDLLDPGLPLYVDALLKRHGVAAHRLCLEITESALMDDPALALAHLGELAALGIKLSIDDYGVGQASLAYLKILPVNELKLDRSFITAIDSEPRNAAIVQSTIMLSHALGLSVVAEGVETEAELAWLRAHGCDVAQGYLVSRPLAAERVRGWIADYAPAAATT